MTVRAVILGALAAAFIAAAGYINDGLLQNTHLVGNHFPISVFGLLIVAVIGVNPALGLLRSRWRFRPAELAVVTALMLASCSVPGSGLMRAFTPTLLMPLHYNRLRPNWQRDRILSYVPEAMIPGGGQYDEKLVDGFINGLGRQDRPIGLGDVPWGQWQQPLATWMPLLLLLGVSTVCLGVIVHRQWSSREHLRYPIAAFATSLMGDQGGGDEVAVFRRRIFWIGLLAVLAVRVVNGLAAWYPASVKVPLSVSFLPIVYTWGDLRRLPGIWQLLRPTIYPTVVAFGFLLSSQVSFSLGIAPVLLAAGSAVLLSGGLDLSGGYLTGGVMHWQRFGSYLALALVIVYTGRHYYWQVLKQAATFLPQKQAESSAVWACRFLILSVAGMVVILARLGLDWPMALVMVCTILMMFLGMARLNAESGFFYCQPYWHPIMLFTGLFGVAALGPKTVAILALLCATMTIDPRECLMPFIINGLKVCDRYGVTPGRAGAGLAGVFALALAVAIPVGLWANYNYGMFRDDAWGTRIVPEMTYGVVERTVNELTEAQLDQAAGLTVWGRLKAMRPNGRFLAATGVGLGLVLVVSALRLRVARFPLHPIIFLVWGTYPLGLFSHSFLLGWLIKSLIMKYAGGREAYRQTTRLMFGVIAGDLLGGLVFMVVAAVYYAVTGQDPTTYRIFPS